MNSAPRPPLRLLVVTIDRLPAWMLSAWGATWVATPALDSLAARGLVFDRLVTPSIDPRETIRDLVAVHPPVAVVTDDPTVLEGEPFGPGVDPAAVTELRHVRAVGTGVVEQDEARTNLARLFDEAVGLVEAVQASGAGDRRMVWCHAGSLGLAWDAPETFREAYVDPEDPPPPLAGGLPNFAVGSDTDPDLVVGVRQVFAGQLTLLDRHLGRLLAAVGCGPRPPSERPPSEQSAGNAGWIVLVAGVRGLPLGLHGWVGCRDDLPPYGEVVHVPAILVDPAGRACGQRYGGLVVPADLGATLRDMMAGAQDIRRLPAAEPSVAETPAAETLAAESWRGRSLIGLLENWSVPPRDRVIVRGERAAAIVTPGWHLLLEEDRGGGEPRSRLFAKPDDFFELTDVADRCPAIAEELRQALAAAQGDAMHADWRTPLSPAAIDGI